MVAAQNGHGDIVQALLAKGADMNAKAANVLEAAKIGAIFGGIRRSQGTMCDSTRFPRRAVKSPLVMALPPVVGMR